MRGFVERSAWRGGIYYMGGGVNRGVCFWCTPHAHIIGIYVHRAAAAGWLWQIAYDYGGTRPCVIIMSLVTRRRLKGAQLGLYIWLRAYDYTYMYKLKSVWLCMCMYACMLWCETIRLSYILYILYTYIERFYVMFKEYFFCFLILLERLPIWIHFSVKQW